jgi:hypothetical protein
LTESLAVKQLEAHNFSKEFMQLDNRKKVVIAKGEKLAILHSRISLDRSEVELWGHSTPKTIVAINVNDDGSIDTITFDDQSQYPEKGELVNIGGFDITNTIFFNNSASSELAYTKVWFLTSKMEGKGWNIKREVANESITEDDDEPNPYAKVGRAKFKAVPPHKPSKLQDICKSKNVVKGDNVFIKEGDKYVHCAFLRAGEKMIHVQNYDTGEQDAVEPKTVYTQEGFKYIPLLGK